MTIQVLDSTDMTGILADAGVEFDHPPVDENAQANESEVNTKQEDPANHPDDDAEGEDGLTPREKRELSAKMLKAVGKRHAARKEAEAFAADQYNMRMLAEQRAKQLEEELAKVRSGAQKQQPGQEDPQSLEKPNRHNFATESEYLDAMIQYGVDQRLAAQREQEARQAAQRAQEEALEVARSRIQKAVELVPDFEDVVGSVDLEVPPAVAGYMQKSDLFAELGYHFAKNPEVLLSLSKLAPDEQLVKLGKIEAKLEPFGSKTQNDSKSSKNQSNGQSEDPAPSHKTGTAPSKARGNAAPVITPLDGTGSADIPKGSNANIRETIQEWSKRNQVNLGMRKRH